MTKSVRFFPHWQPNDTRQVIGFMDMVAAVLEDGPVGTWLEVGAGIGESATLLLGYPQIKRVILVEKSTERVMSLYERFAIHNTLGRCLVHHARSPEAAEEYDPGSLDVVYLDGEHDYGSVREDIEAWLPKANRFLAGHDYTTQWPGVQKAVDECFDDVEVFCDGSWLARVDR